ncbi:NAD(P)-binding protein [Periconia macrospinosa]|uniref:NAD(P)-binding protein n=1 Tax=Periconia macrospinosa TaxID=97972 RepID=A0A2V1E2M1_9PLEO|nr:NAD(P)-binding protein [Periconia macrospinosa]
MARPIFAATKKYHHSSYPSISPSRPELSLKGKNVIITGAGSGMGVDTALHFAEAGASNIALLGRRPQLLLDTKALINKQYPSVNVFTYPTDITSSSQVEAAFSTFVSETNNSKINVLVSNAASIGPRDPIGHPNASVDAFLSSVNENLSAATYLADSFLRYAAPDAVVVNVSSANAYLSMAPIYSAYAVAKAAIIRMWDTVLVSNPKLFVYHTQPGAVDTDMNREYRAGAPKNESFSDDASLPAAFNVWLASEEARFLNGRFVWANWDVDELKERKEEIQKSDEFKFSNVGWMRYPPGE